MIRQDGYRSDTSTGIIFRACDIMLVLVVVFALCYQWMQPTLHWLSVGLRDVMLVHVIRQHGYKSDGSIGTIFGACDIMPVLVVVSALCYVATHLALALCLPT